MRAEVFEAAERQRAALAAGDAAAARRITTAYGVAWRRTRTALDRVLAQLAAARAEGRAPSPSWLHSERRLANVLAELEAGMRPATVVLAAETTSAQRVAVVAARDDVAELVAVSDPGVAAEFARPPIRAFDQLVGHLGDGSPLPALLATLSGDATDALTTALLGGMARGLTPAAMVAQARGALGSNLARALTIARTETMRAYREASRRSMEANPDVIAGWRWQCSLNHRSCASCIAMHGRTFPVTESLDDHVNGRCVAVPVTHTWAAMGFEGIAETAPVPEPGAAVFARWEPGTQRAVLGRAKFEAYQAGEISLDDLVGRRADPRWGTMRYERSLAEVRRSRTAGTDPSPAERLGWPFDLEAARLNAVEAGRRRAAASEARAALEEAATRTGVSPEELAAARAELATVRRALRAEAAAAGQAALDDLERADALRMARPPRLRRSTDVTGRPVAVRGAPGYEFIDSLHPDEVARLRRTWFAPDAPGYDPDQIAQRWVARFGGDPDDAIAEWLERTRRAEAAGALRRGRLPAADAYGELRLDDLVPLAAVEGWDPAAVFAADEWEAAAHVARVRRDQARHFAARSFRPAMLGPAPYRMAEADFVAEMTVLETRWRAIRPLSDDPEFGPVYAPGDQAVLDRLGELVPDGIEDPANPLPVHQLHQAIALLAARAGLR